MGNSFDSINGELLDKSDLFKEGVVYYEHGVEILELEGWIGSSRSEEVSVLVGEKGLWGEKVIPRDRVVRVDWFDSSEEVLNRLEEEDKARRQV